MSTRKIKLRCGEVEGSYLNLLRVYYQSDQYERDTGYRYYEQQRWRLLNIADQFGFSHSTVIGAFAVLSPSSAEAGNYRALVTCCRIARGEVPEHTKVISYSANKAKAITILRSGYVFPTLSGPKVTAFYYSTLDPDYSNNVCIDGHMVNAWTGTPRPLALAIPTRKDYKFLQSELNSAAGRVFMPGPRFQAIIWLAWKRINRIVWSPQLTFEFTHSREYNWKSHD